METARELAAKAAEAVSLAAELRGAQEGVAAAEGRAAGLEREVGGKAREVKRLEEELKVEKVARQQVPLMAWRCSSHGVLVFFPLVLGDDVMR